VTAWQLIVGLTLALGGVVWAVAKADLEDPDLYRWLTRKLVYRAALRLPRGERARWREETMQNVLDLPGRLPPLLWALDTYARSGRWGRMRGAPSRWQALVARTRAAWQSRRSLQEARERERLKALKALSRQLHPSTRARVEVEAEPAHAVAAALDATVALNPASVVSDARIGIPQVRVAGSSFLSKQDKEFLARVDAESEVFLAGLAEQRRDFESRINRWR
jgi:hypothetical protein